MRIIFILSFFVLSFSSFSQTWERSEMDDDLSITTIRIKKVSDGVYSCKLKLVMNLSDEYILSGDIKRYKKGENGLEYCNMKISGKVKGKDINESGKCALKHSGDELLYFDWDEWDDIPKKNPSGTYKKVK